MPEQAEEQEKRMVLAAKADPTAFAPLYERHFSDLFRFIFRRSGDRELTADLVQQAFLKAMLALHRYEPRGLPFRAWLYRIALNELRMYWRKRKEVVMDLTWKDLAPLIEDCRSLRSEEEDHLIISGLNKLKPEQARLIELRYFDGLSFAEVGQVLGIGEEAAKMRTHRVLAILRTYLVPKR